MFKNLVGVILAVAAMQPSYAVEIQNGNILSHQSWTTGSNKIRVVENSTREPVNVKALSRRKTRANSEVHPEWFFLKTTTTRADVPQVVGQPVNITGTSELHIVNASPAANTYLVSQSFCIFEDVPDVMLHGLECTLSDYKVQLDVDGYFDLYDSRLFSSVIEKEGNYEYSLVLTVSKEGSNASSTTLDQGRVSVSRQ